MSETHPRYSLYGLSPPFQGREFVLPVDDEVITIGRGEDCTIVLDAASVSRHHATLRWDRNRFRITDAGSRNGIKVDGRDTRDAFLVPGCTLSIGDVVLRLQAPGQPVEPQVVPAPPPASAVGPKSPTPLATAAPGPQAPTQTALALGTETGPASPEAAAIEGGVPQTRRTAVVMVLLSVLIIGGVIAAWLLIQRAALPSVGRLQTVLVAVNENVLGRTKIIQIGGNWYGGMSADFSADGIAVDDPDIAAVTKFEYSSGCYVVTGLSSGATTARFRTTSGNTLTLRVLVRGRRPDPLAPYDEVPKKLDLRRAEAQKHINAGARLEGASPYKALVEYLVARELMKPFNSYQPYGTAKDRITILERAIEKRYNELRQVATQAYNQKDYDRCEQHLQEIMQLIPDKNDPRYQKAQLDRYDVLVVIQFYNKKRR